MRKILLVAVATLPLLMGVVFADGSSKMFQTPIWVTADFLYVGKHDEAWLFESANKLGIKEMIVMGQGVVGAKSLEALVGLNRLRAFSTLDLPGQRPPLFDLMLVSNEGLHYRCVTQTPRSVVPSISVADFSTKTFPDDKADPDVLSRCTVKPIKGEEFMGLDRDTFRKRYFGPGGNLISDFASLNSNPAFIAEAFDHGFYLRQGDLTGRLVIDNE